MAHEIPEKCCDKCMHVTRMKDPNNIGNDVLICKATPPTAIIGPGDGGLVVNAMHPPVRPDEYCSMFCDS